MHAISLCNLAELGAGVMTDASMPSTMHCIPKGMSVEYLKKAVSTLLGVGTPGHAMDESTQARKWPVQVLVTDAAGDTGFRARIMMWVSVRHAS